jgi:hypothetical protein
MPIEANVSGGSPITASVGETQIDVSVSGGFGPSGASGAAGPQGAQGPAGPAGAAGATTIAGISGLQTALDDKAAASHTHTASAISDSTAAGRALLTGADAAAQRTSLGLGSLATQSSVDYGDEILISASPIIAGQPDSDCSAYMRVAPDSTVAGEFGIVAAGVWEPGGASFSSSITGVVKNSPTLSGIDQATLSIAATYLPNEYGRIDMNAGVASTAIVLNQHQPIGNNDWLCALGEHSGTRGLTISDFGTQLKLSGGKIVFNDATEQTTAWTGGVDATAVTGLAAVATSGSWNDLSDTPSTFTPSAHKASHATGGSDALTAADIGAAATSHTHGAGDITSGTLAAARLPIVLEQTQAVGNSGTSTTLALTTGSVQTVTLNGNCTFTMPTATAGASITLILTQGGTNTATFTGVLWAGGTAPTITATANKVDILVFVSNGTSWFGTAAQNF